MVRRPCLVGDGEKPLLRKGEGRESAHALC